ncbi:hypothetical protein HNP82_001275 [Catenibacillus scindens]|uniref:Uncharacterized protein n=1 Tax=Catenibacillus scindens TaxID=673271 RepID=A0A7W8HAJ2_9FIRM|nr:hypothetical protein [Catenibacillus scindens]MBB5264170.1 hypothetical protein [Catenibacillus scindens]
MNTKDGWKPENSGDQDEIRLEGVIGLHRCYDWKPYSYHRLMRILAENGLKAENLWQGYKANRNPGYRELYRIVRVSDGEVIKDVIDLNGMRRAFAALDIPLEDEKTLAGKTVSRSGRNRQTEAFLQFIRNISSDSGGEK